MDKEISIYEQVCLKLWVDIKQRIPVLETCPETGLPIGDWEEINTLTRDLIRNITYTQKLINKK